MKILHISHNDFTGAGLCAYRLHKSMQSKGIDSKMLVLLKTKDDSSIIQVFKKRYFVYRLFHAVLRRLGIYLFEYDKLLKLSQSNSTIYTRPITPFDIKDNPEVKAADVIHLHWVDDFFDQTKFFEHVKKPIVWTLHDEGMFMGISHYEDKYLPEETMELKYENEKKSMVQNAYNLTFVFLSKYFYEKFRKHDVVLGNKLITIPNGVDPNKYTCFDRTQARLELGLDETKIYFAFVAADISDERKGLQVIIDAINLINDCRIEIIAIGNNARFNPVAGVRAVGPIRESMLMSKYLSASNYFISASRFEAFSQAPIEAMACGLPVIVTPVSGTAELVNEENGEIAKGFSVNDLYNAIKIVLDREYKSTDIRNYVITRFGSNVIMQKYLSLYESIIN